MIGLASLPNRRIVQFAAIGAAVLAAAIALGWRSGEAIDLPAAHAAPTPWILPREDSADTQRDAAFLRARRPWGGGAAFRDIDAAPPAPVGQPWTLLGTIARDNRRYALIRVGAPPAGPVEYRALRDKMPDGSTLDAIDGDGVTTAGPGGVATVHRLFEKNP